ncbi:MAG: beta-mannosidase [Microthrixaceae bacterium]
MGVNAYSLATWWGRNPGCGTMYRDDQLDEFFAALPPHALVRTWAWQGTMAVDHLTGRRDWGPLDRVVAAAERHGALLVLSITSQSGDCDDGHWKDPEWYQGGFRSRWSGDGTTRTATSFDEYVTELVTRYRTSPAVAMWEPVNEPEGAVCAPGYDAARCYGHLTCPDRDGAAVALRNFFDEIGGRIHWLDPGRPVEAGAIGGWQCGWEADRFDNVGASPGIDVLSFHDYTRSPMPNELVDRLARGRVLAKPLLIGEIGAPGGDVPGCPPTIDRATELGNAVRRRLEDGAAGVLLWNADLARPDPCDMTLLPDDPALGLLR